MNTTNLESIFDSRKDFYEKAKKEEKKEVSVVMIVLAILFVLKLTFM